ncbi:TPA: hypothetical protein ACH3X1_013771 [Trebouxia sp. C0004]
MSHLMSELFPTSGDSLDLSELPERVAQVQSELQRLEEAVRQTKERVRQVETTKEAAFARQQVLQEQLEQDLKEVHTLQAQQEDLLALKAVQEQKRRSPDMHTLLQVQRKAARQQLKHVTKKFALICSKFQDRFQSEELDKTSALDMLTQTKLYAELEEARYEFCMQQQTVQETATLLDHRKEGIQRQRVALAEQEDLCRHEDGRIQRLKQAQDQMVASPEVKQANKSIDTVCTKPQQCRACGYAQQQEIERLQHQHVGIKQHNQALELDIARLQTALEALTAAPDMDAQPKSASSVLQHSDTGVFSSHTTPPHAAAQHASAAANAASTKPLLFRQKANPLHNTTEQQHARSQQHLFLYPEGTPLASEQDTERHGLHSRPHAQSKHIQQQPMLLADEAAGREQTQAYTVQEPDSPVQPFQAAHTSSNTPAQNDFQQIRPSSAPIHPPAGCLYQDTTIRRTTTPSRHGRAWTHHEEITVRQIREIGHSEACAAHVPPPNRPQVMQVSEVKEYHRSSDRSQAIKGRHREPSEHSQSAQSMLGLHSNVGKHDRSGSQSGNLQGAVGAASDTFTAYNLGPSVQGRLPTIRGRGRGRGHLTAAQARPAARQRNTVRPRMKRLFQDDAQV